MEMLRMRTVGLARESVWELFVLSGNLKQIRGKKCVFQKLEKYVTKLTIQRDSTEKWVIKQNIS